MIRFSNIISTASTNFNINEENRVQNIILASNAINGTVVKNGEVFSFNKVVGERTKEKGYKKAESIDNKKIVETVGGGICQVSTTLYMAIKKIPLEILEVHRHSIPVKYAKREDESAVSWGELDLRFKNNLNKNIIIESIVNMTVRKSYCKYIRRKLIKSAGNSKIFSADIFCLKIIYVLNKVCF